MNKVDKIFKLVSIILLFLTIVPILSFFIYLYKPLDVFIAILFISSFIGAFLIPFGDLILIFTFFVKLFSKDKTKKTRIQIILTFFSVIIYSYISIPCILFLFYIFASDRINTQYLSLWNSGIKSFINSPQSQVGFSLPLSLPNLFATWSLSESALASSIVTP